MLQTGKNSYVCRMNYRLPLTQMLIPTPSQAPAKNLGRVIYADVMKQDPRPIIFIRVLKLKLEK